jgi:hypothetical protein
LRTGRRTAMERQLRQIVASTPKRGHVVGGHGDGSHVQVVPKRRVAGTVDRLSCSGRSAGSIAHLGTTTAYHNGGRRHVGAMNRGFEPFEHVDKISQPDTLSRRGPTTAGTISRRAFAPPPPLPPTGRHPKSQLPPSSASPNGAKLGVSWPVLGHDLQRRAARFAVLTPTISGVNVKAACRLCSAIGTNAIGDGAGGDPQR